MQNVYDIAHELVRSLKETDQFKNYKAAKAKLDANEQLSKMIADLQEKSMQMQARMMTGEKPSDEEMQQYQSLYGIVLQDPLAAEYLQSEMAFSQIVADIYGIIGDAVK
ncbi:MAG: YlbF family regulator [Firmicutes bacterium]|nr:YlbF family regulator [Bacillota bacterium]